MSRSVDVGCQGQVWRLILTLRVVNDCEIIDASTYDALNPVGSAGMREPFSHNTQGRGEESSDGILATLGGGGGGGVQE